MFRCILATALAVALGTTLTQAQETGEDREGGIIGTGIAGTITELGSIYVNGQHIEIKSGMPVLDAIPAKTAGALKPGETVAVVAMPQGSSWQADHIRQLLPLVGPVSRSGDGEIRIMGVRVLLQDGAVLPEPGTWVAVNGHWQGDLVQAGRIERLDQPLAQARITGSWLGVDADGSERVGAARISGLTTSHLNRGDVVQITGQPTRDGIRAEKLETGLFRKPVGLVQVQGYYSAPGPDGLYTVLGSGLIAYTDMPEMISGDRPVVECGRQGRLGDQPAGSALSEQLGCRP